MPAFPPTHTHTAPNTGLPFPTRASSFTSAGPVCASLASELPGSCAGHCLFAHPFISSRPLLCPRFKEPTPATSISQPVLCIGFLLGPTNPRPCWEAGGHEEGKGQGTSHPFSLFLLFFCSVYSVQPPPARHFPPNDSSSQLLSLPPPKL